MDRYKEDSNGCWIWQGSLFWTGYGQVSYRGKNGSAHRASFHESYGYLPAVVMHTCDVRACINPKHLIAGSLYENATDMINKGRKASTKGICNGQAKLTDRQVISLRKRFTSGVPLDKLCAHYKISKANASLIVNRRTWTHL